MRCNPVSFFSFSSWGKKRSISLMIIGIFTRAMSLKIAVSVHPWSCKIMGRNGRSPFSVISIFWSSEGHSPIIFQTEFYEDDTNLYFSIWRTTSCRSVATILCRFVTIFTETRHTFLGHADKLWTISPYIVPEKTLKDTPNFWSDL